MVDVKKGLCLNCDDPAVVVRLRNLSLGGLRTLIGDADLVVIDEAQRIENIGITAKLIHDIVPEKKTISDWQFHFGSSE